MVVVVAGLLLLVLIVLGIIVGGKKNKPVSVNLSNEKRESIQGTEETGTSYRGKSGKIYYVGKKVLEKGGEGEIHELSDGRKIVKLYRNNSQYVKLQEKLEFMINYAGNPELFSCTTWPEDILYCQNNFVGYVMKRLTGGVILPVFEGPDYENVGWNMRVLTALNLAIAVKTVHDAGFVCGDLQARNIYVNTGNYSVTLMDTDSFHIMCEAAGAFFPCRVGNQEYLAPELLCRCENGESIDEMTGNTFTRETDYFALAVHIFMLLMDGFHPFAARMRVDAKNVEYVPKKHENIMNGNSYFFKEDMDFGTPVGAPSVKILTPRLQEMFQWTFIAGHRSPPLRSTAAEWVAALYELKGNFQKCDQGHYYYSGLHKCPWCS